MRIGGFRRLRASMAAGVSVVVLAVAGCGGDDPPRERAEPPPSTEPIGATTSTSSTTSTTQGTTTTVDPDAASFEPLLIDPALDPEAQVEAAYLHHWDVLMDAYRTGRTDYLDLVYTGEALATRIGEIEGMVGEEVLVGGHVEHNYAISVHSLTEATVMDGYWNHLHRVAPESGEAISEPSGDQVLREFAYVKEGSQWKVHLVTRHTFS